MAAKTGAKMTIEDYLDQLSESSPRRQKAGKVELLNIVNVCEQDALRKKNLSEKQRKRTFTDIAVNNMPRLSAEELIKLYDFLESLHVEINTFFPQFEKAMAEKMGPNNVLHLLNGYNELNRKMSDSMLSRWSEEGSKIVKNWDENDLIFVVKVFHKIQQKPTSPFIVKWAEAITKMDRRLDVDQMLDLFRGCEKLWMRDPEIEMFLEHLIADCDQNEIRKMNNKQLVQLMQALGQLRIDPSRHSSHFVPMWFERIQPKLDQMDQNLLTRIGWVMSRSKVKPPDKTFATDWARNIKSRIDGFTTKELGMTLDGIVHFWLTASNYGPLHQKWIDAATPKLDEFWPQILAPIIFQFHRLGSPPEDDFVRIWLKDCHNKLSSMYIRDLVYVMEGLAAVGKNPGSDFVDDWMIEARKKGTNISPPAAQYLKESLSQLRIEIPVDLKKIVDRAAAKDSKK